MSRVRVRVLLSPTCRVTPEYHFPGRFTEAMDRIVGEGVDAVVMLAHMDWDHDDITLFSNAVRARFPHMPIAFLAGHTHYRRFNQRDSRAISMESGNYFNTIGWVSFDKSPIDSSTPMNPWWRMIDANKATLRALTNRPTEALFATQASTKLRADILKVRHDMGLDSTLGCNPGGTLTRFPPYSASNSSWGMLGRDVIPNVLFQPARNPLMWEVESTGGLRNELYHGTLTVCPLYYPFYRQQLLLLRSWLLICRVLRARWTTLHSYLHLATSTFGLQVCQAARCRRSTRP